ncbi:MAG TPA: hypothetical protein VMS60_15735 [Solirubrobacterales bacterium]|nr:hypothetical protein [Solirubrobacterales bacterium]
MIRRICGYRHCAVDLDEIGKRPQAKYCHDQHRSREQKLRERDAEEAARKAAKPNRTVSGRTRRPNRRRSGTTLSVQPDEVRFVRSLLRGGTPAKLPAERRRALRSKLDHAAERLAA